MNQLTTKADHILVHRGVVVERGRSKPLLQTMRANGGSSNGWEVQRNLRSAVGDRVELSAYCQAQMAKGSK